VHLQRLADDIAPSSADRASCSLIHHLHTERIGRMQFLAWRVMSSPSNTIRPAVGSTMRRIASPVVVAQPLADSPRVSPCRSVKLTPSTALPSRSAPDQQALGEGEVRDRAQNFGAGSRIKQALRWRSPTR
jgi:hypothetical protein